jgi:V8-like Glu-specific endopeptidase
MADESRRRTSAPSGGQGDHGGQSGESVPVPTPRKRAKPDRGKDAPAKDGGYRAEAASARPRRLSKRDGTKGGAEAAADPYSLVLKGEPSLPFDGWPVPARAEAAGGPLLPASVASYGPLPETVLNPDDRKRVADFADPNSYPFRAICRLVITSTSGGTYLGTGWLIGPRVLATAGHNVWLHDDGGWAAGVEVTPAYTDGSAPFGSQVTDDLHVSDGWANNDPESQAAKQSDYAAIILPAPVSVGFFGFGVYSDAELSGMTVNVYGYPSDKNSGSALYGAFRKLVGVTARQVSYNISTAGGQSGCPAYVQSGGEVVGVGIHAYGGATSNRATRITDQVFADLEAWKALGG